MLQDGGDCKLATPVDFNIKPVVRRLEFPRAPCGGFEDSRATQPPVGNKDRPLGMELFPDFY